MKGINKFCEIVMKELKERYGEGFEIQHTPMMKNNSVEMQGITIKDGKSNTSPCIYLDAYYERYLSGKMNMEEIVADIAATYEENSMNHDIDISEIMNFDKVKPRLRGKLINTERNSHTLENIPSRKMMDLSLVYYIEVITLDDGIGTILVSNEHVKMWKIEEEDLYMQIMENMKVHEESKIFNIEEILNISGEEEILLTGHENPMYIVSNETGQYGALQILNPFVVEQIVDLIGNDFMIIPSSINEMLVLPECKTKEEKEKMAKLVKEVNDTCVAPIDILSYHVYQYNSEKGMIEIAA